MPVFTVHDAKTNLSKLIERAENGEDVVIACGDKPAVKLVPVGASKPTLVAPVSSRAVIAILSTGCWRLNRSAKTFRLLPVIPLLQPSALRRFGNLAQLSLTAFAAEEIFDACKETVALGACIPAAFFFEIFEQLALP